MRKAQKIKSKQKPIQAAMLLIIVLLACTGCGKQTVDKQLATLSKALDEAGYACTITPLSEVAPDTDVPIHDATVWYSVKLGEEELLVYFDSSNRAKQLAKQFCTDPAYGRTIAYGLRYIISYQGSDTEVDRLLDSLENAL